MKPRGNNHFLELLLAFSVWAPECCCCCRQDSPDRVQTENPYAGQETSQVSAAQDQSTSEACARGSGEGRRTRKQGSRRSLLSVPWLLIPHPGGSPLTAEPSQRHKPPTAQRRDAPRMKQRLTEKDAGVLWPTFPSEWHW